MGEKEKGREADLSQLYEGSKTRFWTILNDFINKAGDCRAFLKIKNEMGMKGFWYLRGYNQACADIQKHVSLGAKWAELKAGEELARAQMEARERGDFPLENLNQENPNVITSAGDSGLIGEAAVLAAQKRLAVAGEKSRRQSASQSGSERTRNPERTQPRGSGYGATPGSSLISSPVSST